MKVFRIARSNYANDLSGEGAKRYGGRWNKKGTPMLYTSAHISLAFLELLVNADQQHLIADYKIIEIDIPVTLDVNSLDQSLLAPSWRDRDHEGLKNWGSEWCEKKREPILAVPSAVIPYELNYLINPLHSHFTEISISKIFDLEIDARFR